MSVKIRREENSIKEAVCVFFISINVHKEMKTVKQNFSFYCQDQYYS